MKRSQAWFPTLGLEVNATPKDEMFEGLEPEPTVDIPQAAAAVQQDGQGGRRRWHIRSAAIAAAASSTSAVGPAERLRHVLGSRPRD